MSLELPPPCARCGKAILFVPFSVTILDGAFAAYHDYCVPKRQERITGHAATADASRAETLR